VPIPPDQLPDDPDALKAIIAAMARDATAAQVEIARLRFQLARYRRAEFGRSSEKLAREVEQLELAIEALEADQAERLAAAPAVVAMIEAATETQKHGAAPAAATPAARGRAASRAGRLSRLRRRVAPDRRRRQRDARLRAGPLQSDPAYPRETVVPGL
jgi:hypothetical protein